MQKTQRAKSKAVVGGMVVLMALALFLPACQSWPWQKKTAPPPAVLEPLDAKGAYTAPDVSSPGLALSPSQRFKDIPLPMGAKEDLERTFVFESPSLQIGRMVYTSRAKIADLTQFFIRECPATQWKLQKVLEAQGKSLVYTKPGKQLVVTVQKLGLFKGRRIIIELTPASEPGTGL